METKEQLQQKLLELDQRHKDEEEKEQDRGTKVTIGKTKENVKRAKGEARPMKHQRCEPSAGA